MDDLFEKLKHPNPNLRKIAMGEIAQARDENTIPRLMSLLGEEDVTYRRAAVKTLGVIGYDTIPSIIETLKTSDDAVVKASCGKALAQVAVNYPKQEFPAEAMAQLRASMDDPNPVVHIVAVMALGTMGTQALDTLLDGLENNESLSVGVSIINALGSIIDPKALEVLNDISNDETKDAYLQQSAKSAASRLEQITQFKQANDRRNSSEQLNN